MSIPKGQKCEAHVGADHDEAGDPVLIACQNPATVKKDIPKLPFPVFLCDSCNDAADTAEAEEIAKRQKEEEE